MDLIVSIIFLYNKDCFSICVISTSLCVYLLEFFIFFRDNYFAVKILETIFFLAFMISYLITSLINPGIPNRDHYSKYFIKNNPDLPSSSVVKCSICNIVVPKHFRISHCNTCQVCVKNYDHHCPWTGKCIGERNLTPFYIFLFFLLGYMFMSFITFITYIINWQEMEFQRVRKSRRKIL